MMVDRLGQQFSKYRLVKLLGKGGFAEVYLAEHLYQERQAVIKILNAQLSDSRAIHRFRQEARAIAHLEHANVVRILDFGVEDTAPYLVMDYAANGTLRQRHPRGNRLPLGTVVSYVTQIANALQYAHSKRVVHRDVKPTNMLIGEYGEILLSDFDMAVLPQASNSMTIEEMAGTVVYMAPEQIQAQAQPASDQYALATVAYEWLCGALPFEETGSELVLQHLSTPPLPLKKWILVAPEIEEVILRALHKDPEERFASVQEFASALALAAQKISFSSIFPTQTSITPIVAAKTATVSTVSEPVSGVLRASTHIPGASSVSTYAPGVSLLPEHPPGAPLTTDPTSGSAPLLPEYTPPAVPSAPAPAAGAPLTADPTLRAPLMPEYISGVSSLAAPAASAPPIPEHTPGIAPFTFTRPLPSAPVGTDWPQDEEQKSIPTKGAGSGWAGAELLSVEPSAPFAQALPPGPFSPAPDFLVPAPPQSQPPLQVPHTDYPQPEPFRLSRRAMLFGSGGVLVGGGLVYLAVSHFAGHGAERTTPGIGARATPHTTPTGTVASTTTKTTTKVIPSNTPRLYVAWKGLGADQRLFWSSLNRSTWLTQQQMPGQASSTEPALAVFGGKLYMVWKGPGSDTRLYWSTFNRTTWASQQQIPQAATGVSPALVTLGNTLYLVWTGTNQTLNWSSFNGHTWSSPQAIPNKGSSARPAVASFRGKIYMAWKGQNTDQHLLWASSDGTTWSAQQQLSGGTPQSSAGPGLSAFGQKLYLTWKGGGSGQNIWGASFDGTAWSTQQQLLSTSIVTGPALTSFNGGLFMSWINANQRTYWSSFNGTAWSAARSLGAFSSSACPILTGF